MADKEYDDSILEHNEYEHILFDDGKIVVYSSDDEREKYPVHPLSTWEFKHEDLLKDIYVDFVDYAHANYLLDFVTLYDFVDYMKTMNTTTPPKDKHVWNQSIVDEYAEKFLTRSNPPFYIWSIHYLDELFSLYSYLHRLSPLNIGGFETFMDFVFDHSADEIK